jgi:carbonic anhydrase
MIQSGDVGICGAMYNVETGLVDFYEDTVAQGVKN